MDSQTANFGAILMTLIIIPFIIVALISRNKKKLLKQNLFKLAENNGCKISHFNQWKKSTIGIDEASRKVFFTKKVNDIDTTEIIDLGEIQRCRVINGGTGSVVNRLELAFAYANNSKTEAILQFYNSDIDGVTLTDELELVEKWCRIINENIVVPKK